MRTRKAELRLQTFWTGSPLSRMERAALQSYVNVGYTVHIYTYNPLAEFRKQVPASNRIRVYDARDILPESELFQYSGRAAVGKREDAYRYLPFSDLFRFTMLQKNGGAWIDLDIFLTRRIPRSILRRPYVFSSERTIQKGQYRNVKPEIVDMGFIKVDGPNSALMTLILEKVPGANAVLKTPFDYMNVYRRAIEELDLGRYVLPADAFLPLNWWDVKDAFGEGSGLPGVCYVGKYGTEPFCVDDLKQRDVYGVHWFRAIVRKKDLPYETVEGREVTDNLYERMIAAIETKAGLSKNSL
jgi:hypothetical protein